MHQEVSICSISITFKRYLHDTTPYGSSEPCEDPGRMWAWKPCLYPSSDANDGFLMGLKDGLSWCLFVYRMSWGCLIWWFTYHYILFLHLSVKQNHDHLSYCFLVWISNDFEFVAVYIYLKFCNVCVGMVADITGDKSLVHWWLRLIVYRQGWCVQKKKRTLNPRAAFPNKNYEKWPQPPTGCIRLEVGPSGTVSQLTTSGRTNQNQTGFVGCGWMFFVEKKCS